MCEILFITGFDRIYRIFETTFYAVKIKYFTSILLSAKLCNCEINTWRCK